MITRSKRLQTQKRRRAHGASLAYLSLLSITPALAEEKTSTPSTDDSATPRADRTVPEVGAVKHLFAEPGADDTQTSRQRCIVDHEQAQLARLRSELLRSRQLLRRCRQNTCPGPIQRDCVLWASEVDQLIPSIVIEARADGVDITAVRVELDHQPLLSRLDGQAIEVEPGRHQLVFFYADHAPIERKLVLNVGSKRRTVRVEFVSPARRSASEHIDPLAPAAARSIPWTSYASASVGLLGIAGFVYLASSANGDVDVAKTKCGSFCSDAVVARAERKYIAGDVSLGIGLASLGASLLFYLTHSEVPATVSRDSDTWSLGVTPRAASIRVRRVF